MQIAYDRNKLLGEGRYAKVFEGVLGKKPVAVKRIQLEDIAITKQEEEALGKLHHRNVTE